jgi:hypothetical protein
VGRDYGGLKVASIYVFEGYYLYSSVLLTPDIIILAILWMYDKMMEKENVESSILTMLCY